MHNFHIRQTNDMIPVLPGNEGCTGIGPGPGAKLFCGIKSWELRVGTPSDLSGSLSSSAFIPLLP